jgi:hypothetical protein
MYPLSIGMNHTLRNDVKTEYQQVQLTQEWPNWKVNKTKDG